MTLPTLDTPRLHLRPFAPADLDAYYRQIWSDDAVMRYLPAGKATERARAQDFLVHIISHWRTHSLGLFAVSEKTSGAFMGHCGLNWLPDHQVFEIGYAFGQAFWGRGYATESGAVVLEHGFMVGKLARIVGMTLPDNLASQHVLQKLGMEAAGTIQAYGATLPLFALWREDFLRRRG